MDFDAAALAKFMEALSVKDSRIAGGLLWFLSCMDSDNSLHSASDTLFWGTVGGKIRGVSRQLLTESYQEYLKDVRRAKDRERQRKYREMSREKCDKCHAENVTKSVTLSRKNCDKTPDLSREMSRFTRDSLPSPSSPSPAPFLPPLPPTPPITPYNPPNPNPVIPIQYTSTKISRDTAVLAESARVRERLNIDSAWETSERARIATAHRLVDWIRAAELPAAKYNTLYDLVYSSLDMGIAPDTIIAAALTDNGNSFSGDLSNAQLYALKKRGLL